MANAATLNSPSSSKIGVLDEATTTIRDRILGALYAITRGTNRPVNLSEVRERLTDVNGSEFDRVISWLDREGTLVLDRGADTTYVKLTSPTFVSENVPCPMKDRVLGAICSVARGPYRMAPLHEVRARLVDFTPIEIDHAIVALTMRGDIEIGQGLEQGWVRLSPFAKAIPGYFAGMPGYQNGMPGYQNVMPGYQNVMPTVFHGPTPGYGMVHPFMVRPLVERVAQQLWEMRGRHSHYDHLNWVEAEQIVHQQLCGHHGQSFGHQGQSFGF
jgi:hypothetical protein